MSAFFDAIREGDLKTVKKCLKETPALINAKTNKIYKREKGRSPLEFALNYNKPDVAEYLLDCGADVNYMPCDSVDVPWRMPVIHEAVMMAVNCVRWNVNDEEEGFKVFNSKEKSDRGYCILKRMIEMGADISVRDSYGNTILDRAIKDAKAYLPSYDYGTRTYSTDRIVTDELREDLSRIFRLLLNCGARVEDMKNRDAIELHAEEAYVQFLK
ncbi:MAG: hypothetical protein ACI4EN_10770 [Butyrivibrio sp.]